MVQTDGWTDRDDGVYSHISVGLIEEQSAAVNLMYLKPSESRSRQQLLRNTSGQPLTYFYVTVNQTTHHFFFPPGLHRIKFCTELQRSINLLSLQERIRYSKLLQPRVIPQPLSYVTYLLSDLICRSAATWLCYVVINYFSCYPLNTALRVGRSRVRFPIVPLEFFIDIILPAALWPWGRRILLSEMSPRKISWG